MFSNHCRVSLTHCIYCVRIFVYCIFCFLPRLLRFISVQTNVISKEIAWSSLSFKIVIVIIKFKICFKIQILIVNRFLLFIAKKYAVKKVMVWRRIFEIEIFAINTHLKVLLNPKIKRTGPLDYYWDISFCLDN